MTKYTVIIPTAGLGSRMKDYTNNLNKALLPYKNKPVIAHIIDKFPKDTHFVIPVGYLKDQIIDFCKIAYDDRDITFVNVDYESKKAGTGYSLLQCKEYINSPFWYVTCDTFFDESIYTPLEDCYYVKKIPQSLSHLYTMFKIDKNIIQDITFKETAPEDWVAWTGLMYINDYYNFFDKLSKLDSNEFISLIKKGNKCKKLNTWLDFGNPTIYSEAVSKSLKFDFSKKNEITYICNNKVIKWWLSTDIPKKKIYKYRLNPKVFPLNCKIRENFIVYDFYKGKTLYQLNDVTKFRKLLKWVDSNVWDVVNHNIYNSTMLFYKDKTINRINMFLKKYPELQNITHVNGTKISHYKKYLDDIDFEDLSNKTLPSFIHGDLQFDNILINDSDEFILIDWRQDFADSVDFGDIYYDLAKLVGCFIINYARIKQHDFSIKIDGTKATISVPNIDDIKVYQKTLKEFVESKGWNYKKVQTLVPIIYWNMAPLHEAPFDKLLWYYGMKLFEDLKNKGTL